VPVPIGTAVGLLGALALTRVLQGLLFRIKSTDSPTIGMVAGALAISPPVACLAPSGRAEKWTR
jgi:hypothetical protein